MAILVTGMSGFVGSWCAQHMDCVDLLVEGRLADLRNAAETRAAVAAAAPQAVIHLAAQASVAQSITDPQDTYDVNFGGTLNLLGALRDTGFRGRMLYIGSADGYGIVPEAELPVREERAMRPRNPYAVSKVAAEALCYQWSQAGPFEVVIARPFNHIGPRQSDRFAIASFARQIAACKTGRGPARLRCGDIDITRDFTDVRDIVRAYAALLAKGHNGEAYNVCSGVDRPLRSVIADMMQAAGVQMEIEVDAHLLRGSEQRHMRGSYDKLKKHTGWRPEIEFLRTLADTLAWWEQQDAA